MFAHAIYATDEGGCAHDDPRCLHGVSRQDLRDYLRAMTGRGVQLVDMTDISGAVFAAKEPRDCLNDPLHPNDYLSRWFAQSMLAALMPIATAAQPTPPGPDPAGKKGVGDDDKEAPEAIDATHSSWYYNWTPRRSTGAIHAAFVPMLWGATSVDSDLAAAVASGAKELLAFNEPDSESQGNVTVDQAIALGGGFTQRGSHSRIDVIRASDPQHKPARVELTDPVFPGDIITVKQSIF